MPKEELSSQKIYRTMDKLDEFCKEIETAICRVINSQDGITFETMYLDFTNQETYSRNHDSGLLDYGHNKRGKDELCQVNISLCCDAASGIPFFHKTYPGNYNDKQFIHTYAKELRGRLDDVGCKGRNLLVMDRGINGRENFELLLENRFDYLGGMIEREFPDYFGIPKSSMTKRFSHQRKANSPLKVQYITRTDDVYGRKHQIVAFYNQENYDKKIEQLGLDLAGFERQCNSKLAEIRDEIMEKTFQSRWNNLEKIKKCLYEMDKTLFSLLKFKIKSYRFELSWSIKRDEKAIREYTDKFGKHVLFTNRLDLKDKEILGLFFSKDKIEKNFQFLKSNGYTNRFIVLGPMLHSKDCRITSHVYTCIIALQLYQLLRSRLEKSNLDITTQTALEALKEIECYYITLLGKKEVIRHMNPLSDEQKKILRAFRINIFV
jgi:transposase